MTLGALCLLGTACTDDDGKDVSSTFNLSSHDKQYIDQVAYINLGEIEAGNIARAKATNTAVIEYGNMMVNDHTQAQSALVVLASQKNHTSLPTQTDQSHKDMSTHLNALSGEAFDSTYIYMMSEGHSKAIALFQEQMNSSTDAGVKKYAAQYLPVIQQHKRTADSLATVLYPR